MKRIEFENSVSKKTATNIRNIQNDIYIGHYGFENSNENKEYIHSSLSPAFRLYFITKGKGYLNIGKKVIPLHKNMFFIILPGTDMGYGVSRQNPLSYYWISFQGSLAKESLHRIGLNENTPILFIEKPAKILNCFYNNFVIPESQHFLTDIIFLKNFYKIMECILTTQIKTDQAHKNKTDYIYQAIEYINRNFTKSNLTIKEVAAYVGIHENYLSNLFKKSTNVLFSQYVAQKRIQFAVSLMDEGYTSVKEIAYKCGFESQFYFSKIFKKFNDISPSEHINKILKTKKDI